MNSIPKQPKKSATNLFLGARCAIRTIKSPSLKQRVVCNLWQVLSSVGINDARRTKLTPYGLFVKNKKTTYLHHAYK